MQNVIFRGKHKNRFLAEIIPKKLGIHQSLERPLQRLVWLQVY